MSSSRTPVRRSREELRSQRAASRMRRARRRAPRLPVSFAVTCVQTGTGREGVTPGRTKTGCAAAGPQLREAGKSTSLQREKWGGPGELTSCFNFIF